MQSKFLKCFILLFVICSNVKIGFAQITNADYEFIANHKSSTQRAISCFVQAEDDLVWMGTNGVGLLKFNGIDFKTYEYDNSQVEGINSSIIYATYIDSEQKLWVGTESGLNLYQKNTDSFINIPLSKDLSATFPISSIQEINEDELLLGSHYYGLLRYNKKTGLVASVDLPIAIGDATTKVNQIVSTKNNRVFVATTGGLLEFKDNQTYIVEAINETKSTSKISSSLESLLLDTNNSLWVGTFAGELIKISGLETNSLHANTYPITKQRILTLVQSPTGDILCGTENDGLYVVAENGAILKNYLNNKYDTSSIKSNSIWSLFLDKQQRIWIGYYNKGFGIYDKNHDKFGDIASVPNRQNSLQSSSVRGITKDKLGRFWIAMDGGGVDCFNPSDNNFTHLIDQKNPIAKGLTSADVQTIFNDSKENIWVGTWSSGIYLLRKNKKYFEHFTPENTNNALKSNRILSFDEDTNGTIWIGTFLSGLHSYNPKKNTFNNYDLAFSKTYREGQKKDIRKVLVDSQGIIWLATGKGLLKVKATATGNLAVVDVTSMMYEKRKGLFNNTPIVALYEDENDNIWIGTDGAGVCKFDVKANDFEWFDKNIGVQQSTIAAIVADDFGDIWLAGNNGITKLNPKEKTVVNFNTNDGLLANDFNFNSVYKDQDGTLFFGNYHGINQILPNKIVKNTVAPKIYFSKFKLSNKQVTPKSESSPLEKVISETDEITLTHEQSVFTIEYMGVNFTRPEKNKYAYYLEGFDTSWNQVGATRSATYTNLPAGDYTFKVKAANNDGVWSTTPKTLRIHILSPWWATNTAIAVFGVLIFGIGYVLYRLFQQRIQATRLVKFEREKRMHEENLHDSKIQFFTNISHEFRTPLTLILNPLKDIIDNASFQLPQKVKSKHAIIYKNTTRLKRLIDELMDFRKLQINKLTLGVTHFDAVAFVQDIAAYFEEEAQLKNIMFSVEAIEMPLMLWSDTNKLEKVIFNLLSNAFKFTPENGVITIGVYKSAKQIIFPSSNNKKCQDAIEIIIEDTGSGIQKDEVLKIFDRFYQVKNMNKQYYGGTGIGLEVVKSFVDLLKGNIEVESEVTFGTKFRVFLPLGNQHFNPSELIYSDEAESTKTERLEVVKNTFDSQKLIQTSAKKTVLIAEDNTELRTYLKVELIEEYNILEAANGKEAMALALQKVPDLIITDVVMPEMDGLEFCDFLKANIKTSHIPVLMLTAKIMAEDQVKGIDAGADVYMCKPFEMLVLRAHLKRLITSRHIIFTKNELSKNAMVVPENTAPIDKSFIDKVLDYIKDNIENESLSVEVLAEELFLSRSQLYRKIKALTGLTANELLRKVRLERAKYLLEHSENTVSQVSFKVGFSSPSYFTRCFKAQYGILPTEVK